MSSIFFSVQIYTENICYYFVYVYFIQATVNFCLLLQIFFSLPSFQKYSIYFICLTVMKSKKYVIIPIYECISVVTFETTEENARDLEQRKQTYTGVLTACIYIYIYTHIYIYDMLSVPDYLTIF